LTGGQETILHAFPWIHKFVIATIGCGINHDDTKHYCNNKITTTQKLTNMFSKNYEDKTKNKFDIKYTYIIQDPYNIN
jgi:hypothetical protein